MKTIDLFNPWWVNKKIDLGILRDLYLSKIKEVLNNRKQILFILGSRRVGKTMILLQYVNKLIEEGTNPKKILFLSLDNTNLIGFDLFSYVVEGKFEYVFLDEVHYFPEWARILKSLYDLPSLKTKIICSGSSSKLIEDNKAYLTGRETSFEVLPLLYDEFGKFNMDGEKINDYLFLGGYPEYVLERQSNYLNELLRDIVEKDILRLHIVKNKQYFFDICQILARQIGFKNSSNKMAKVVGLDNKTVVNYLEYLREVRLINFIYQYSDSINARLYSPKKYYFNDLGMRNSFVGFSDIGSLVENAIYLKLADVYGFDKIFYLLDKGKEVDFVVEVGRDEIMLIESKYLDLKDGVINSLNKLIFGNIYNKKIIKRVVVTDGVGGECEYKGVKAELIGLEKFLKEKDFK